MLRRTILASLLATLCRANDGDILREFYDSMSGPSWTNNYGWEENLGDMCHWHGVVCAHELSEEIWPEGASANDILGINLRSNFLSGRTPASVWTLPYLLFVDFSFNAGVEVDFNTISGNVEVLKIYDTSTRSLSGISRVKESLDSLHASGIPLESGIPDELYQLTNLRYLYMENAALSGQLSTKIGDLVKMKEFNLADNSLSGDLPTELYNMADLHVLALSKNHFTGSLNAEGMNSLSHLRQVYLDRNKLSGILPAFNTQQYLWNLQLHDNKFGGPIPDDFLAAVAPSEDTVTVDLRGNGLTSIPASLDNLEPLYLDIYLGDNMITSLPSKLCDNANWTGVESHKCSGILCPAHTFAPTGRTTDEYSCQVCSGSEYLGAQICSDTGDYSVLEQLFTHTDGEGSWKTKWNLAYKDFCQWYGIWCNLQGRVTKVQLPDNGLQGEVPASIFQLKYMTELDLSRNAVSMKFDRIQDAEYLVRLSFAFTLVSDFRHFDEARFNNALEHLHADGLPASGTLPTEICSVRTLKSLSMASCGFVGEIPTEIGNLGRLEELYLYENEFRGQLPSHVGQLQNLKIMSFAKNQLTGGIPSQIVRMPKLTAVSLAAQKGVGLSGPLPTFEESASLRSIILNDNSFTGEVPGDLLRRGDLDAGMTVQLANNKLSGSVPGALARFAYMNLYVDGNEITSLDPRLCALDGWMSGDVVKFGCAAILCPAGTEGGRQVYDDKPCTPCTGEIGELWGQTICESGSISEEYAVTEDEILSFLFEETGGVGWHMHENWMSEKSVCEWYGVSCNGDEQVVSLTLASNQLVGSFPTEIFRLPALEKLVLYKNEIEFSFEGIENADKLRILVLDNIGLTSLRGAGNAPALEELNVRSNELIGDLPQDISRLSALKLLDISYNFLTGDLPDWLSSLQALTSFKASNNKISGKLFDFANMRSMNYIDLSSNMLDGSIPATMLLHAKTEEKMFLSLANNRLSGEIPANLAQFPKLSLNVADNAITSIGAGLCSLSAWNDYDVSKYDCDGIACPAGTANSAGRQTSDLNPCRSCPQAKFMGSTDCSNSASLAAVPLSWTILSSSVIGLYFLLS